jgi:MoxR-like ATPase
MTQDQNASASTTAPKINNSKAPQQLVALMAHLNSVNLEREPEVSAIMGAIIAGQHVFMLGKPGIAKSHLIEAICKKIDGGKIFKRLFSATTERTELMGPISLRELEQHDHIVHNYKNMLPEAEFFFADELFKANSQTLNDLLGILNERVFDNGGTRIQTPF